MNTKLAISCCLTTLGLAWSNMISAQDQSGSTREVRGLVVLRVSEKYLCERLGHEINDEQEVRRNILGTTSSGTARTTGQVAVDLKPDNADAMFGVVVTGTTQSQSSGRNGPAIIESRTTTEWQVAKIVQLERSRFVTRPATVDSQTSVEPLFFDSVLPGLRGELVKRIASQRFAQSRETAESIVDRDTRQQVAKRIDDLIDEHIASLDQQLHTRPIFEKALSAMTTPSLELSTDESSVRVAYSDQDHPRPICPLDRLEPERIEVWIHISLLGLPETIPPNDSTTDHRWIATLIEEMGIEGLELARFNKPDSTKTDQKETQSVRLTARWVDEWLVFGLCSDES